MNTHLTTLALILSISAAGSLPETAAAQTSSCSDLPDSADAAIQADCKDILRLNVETELKKAEADAQVAGLNTSTERLKSGSVTISGDDTKGLPSILANLAAVDAAAKIAEDVCIADRKIILGLPEHYTRDFVVKTRLKHTAEILSQSVTIADKTLDEMADDFNDWYGDLTKKSPDDNSVQDSIKFGFSGPTAIASMALNAANTAIDLSKLFRSDTTITPVSVTIDSNMIQDAISAISVDKKCSIFNPANALPIRLSERESSSELTLKLDAPFKQGLALQNKASQLRAAVRMTRDSMPTDSLSKKQIDKINNEFGKFLGLIDAVVSPTVKNLTDLTTLFHDETGGSSRYMRALRADIISEKLNNEEFFWLDVTSVQGAGASIISKGAFRTDRLHYTGSSLLRFRLLNHDGYAVQAGLRGSNSSMLVKDSDGFAMGVKKIDTMALPICTLKQSYDNASTCSKLTTD